MSRWTPEWIEWCCREVATALPVAPNFRVRAAVGLAICLYPHKTPGQVVRFVTRASIYA